MDPQKEAQMDPLKRIQQQKEELIKQMTPAEPDPTPAEPAPVEPDPTPAAPAPAEPATPVVPAATNQPDFQAEATKWKAKWESEVPKLHTWVQQKDAEIAKLREELEALKAGTPATPAPPAAPRLDEQGDPIYVSPHVDDEIRNTDNYRWHVKQIGETATEMHFESLVLAGQRNLKPLKEEISQVKAETEEEKFNRELSSRCPSWTGLQSGINLDPEFCEWVANTPAPGTGGTIKDLLGYAYRSANLQAMAEIIDLYHSLKPAPATPPPAPTAEHLVAPSRKGGGQQTIIDANQGQVMRMSDMNKLYDDYRNGLYRGKEAEYQKRKAEFMKAKAEGRLIP